MDVLQAIVRGIMVMLLCAGSAGLCRITRSGWITIKKCGGSSTIEQRKMYLGLDTNSIINWPLTRGWRFNSSPLHLILRAYSLVV